MRSGIGGAITLFARLVPRPFLAILAAVVVLEIAPTASGGTAHLILDSDPGSYIGQGMNWDITDTNAMAFSDYPSYNLPDGEWTNLEIEVFQSGTVYAATTFSTHMLGIPIQPGMYDNAERFPFEAAGNPGLDVTFFDEGSDSWLAASKSATPRSTRTQWGTTSSLLSPRPSTRPATTTRRTSPGRSPT
jgi:hypothetical protein